MTREVREASVETSPLLLGRERLVAAVQATPPGGTCLLLASAGHGRRTVLQMATGSDAAVLRLGARHADVHRWRTDVLHALGSGIVTDDRPTATDLLDALATSHVGWLVVEDVDPQEHQAVLDDLRTLVRDCPTDHRVALTASSDLGGVLAEARLAGRLVELDQPDLRLSEDESTQLLTLLAPTLTPGTREQIVALCDGWLAALVAVTQRHALDPAGDVTTWLRSRGAEQLLSPWLDSIPEPAREMLLDTAIVTALRADLIDAVLPGLDSGAWLARLARGRGPLRAILVRAPGDPLEYRRDPLLLELLRRLSTTRPDEGARHLRAASWYRSQGVLPEEITHLIAAGRPDQAAERLVAHEDELFATGQADTTLRWYDSLSAGDSWNDAEHLLRQGWAMALSGDISGAHVALARLNRMLGNPSLEIQAPERSRKDFDGEAATLEAWLAQYQGDVLRMLAASSRARARFGDRWTRTSHMICALHEARARLLLGQTAAAHDLLASIRDLPFSPAALSEGARADLEADVAWARGEVFESRTWSARKRRWLAAQDPGKVLDRHGGCVAHWLVEAEAGHRSEALAGLEHAAFLAHERSGIATDHVQALLALAHVSRLDGDPASALAHVHLARGVVQQRSPSGGLLGPVALAEARIMLAAGDAVRAARVLRGVPRTQEALLVRARLHLLRGGTTAAEMLREFEPTCPREEVEQIVLFAWVQLDVSRRRAEQQLILAADLSVEHGMTTGLLGMPPAVLELARRTATHHVHDHLDHLVTVALRARQTSTGPAPSSDHVHSTLLTRGELQLLKMLPTRASNRGIADELGVSVNTVKTRLRRLYAKLDVHDRDSAVARATSMGIGLTPHDRP